jgi:hypothetical protein
MHLWPQASIPKRGTINCTFSVLVLHWGTRWSGDEKRRKETWVPPMTPADRPELERLCRLILERGGPRQNEIQGVLLRLIEATAAAESVSFLLAMLHYTRRGDPFGHSAGSWRPGDRRGLPFSTMLRRRKAPCKDDWPIAARMCDTPLQI